MWALSLRARGRWMVSQVRTSRKKSSEVMGCLRESGFDVGVGEPAQVRMEIGCKVEVVPGVLRAAVPKMQTQIGNQCFRVAAGENAPRETVFERTVLMSARPSYTAKGTS